MTDEPQSVDSDHDQPLTRPPAPDAREHDVTFLPVEHNDDASKHLHDFDSKDLFNATTGPDGLVMPSDRRDDQATNDDGPRDSTDAAVDDDDDMDRGLARLDPLAIRPRRSSVVLCVVFGVLMLAAAAGVWWLGVRTAQGQSYDDLTFVNLAGLLPGSVRGLLHLFANSRVVIIVSVVIGVAAVAIMLIRRRWWLIGQAGVVAILSYALHLLKYVLPRSILVNTVSKPDNSAPSGHTILAAAAAMLLVLAVPRVWRAVSGIFAACFSAWIGLSVIVGGWHRPTDVVMALLLVGGVVMLALAFTRGSGMDAPGSRFSSAAIQIVASSMITLGLLGVAYAAYVIWQIEPGLEFGAQWAISGAVASSGVLIVAVAVLVFGMVLAMRQLTAAPLTRIGLVGAPPTPPKS